MSNADEDDTENALWWEMVARRNDLNKRARELYAAIAMRANGDLMPRSGLDYETARRRLAEAAKAYKKTHEAYVYEVFGAAGEPEVNP